MLYMIVRIKYPNAQAGREVHLYSRYTWTRPLYSKGEESEIKIRTRIRIRPYHSTEILTGPGEYSVELGSCPFIIAFSISYT